MEFRKDINGLRAIAVVSVMLFHFNKQWVPGGFAGVDVFFVISGFLMTKIILSRLDKRAFSLSAFYSARAKRIIPALAATSILVLVIGYLFISPKDYFRLSQDAASSMLFMSNFWYAANSGYFDPSSAENFFLHTWSLSVEWQFYIIYPIILLAIYNLFSRKVATAAIYIMFAASFALGVFYTYNSASYAYYMFPMRAWEMLAGAVCFLHENVVKSKRESLALELLGVFLILLSLFMFDEFTPWPGYQAFIPALGASLVIIANNQKSFITSGLLQQNVGKVSYSAYLIHWPVLVFYWKLGLSLSFAWYILLVATLTVIMHFIFERSRSINIKNCIVYLVGAMGCLVVYLNNGYEERVSDEFRLSQAQFHGKYYGGSGFPANKIFYENSNNASYKYIFTGDSFAAQYAKEVKSSGLPSAEIYSHGCPLFPDYSRALGNKESDACTAGYKLLKQLMDGNENATLIYSLAWDKYKDIIIKKGESARESLNNKQYSDLIKGQVEKIISIGGPNRQYYFVGRTLDTKVSGFDCLSGKSLLGYKYINSCKSEQEESRPPINMIVREIANGHANVHFIDPNDFICSESKCKTILNGQPVYSDLEHLSIYGAAPVFKGILTSIN